MSQDASRRSFRPEPQSIRARSVVDVIASDTRSWPSNQGTASPSGNSVPATQSFTMEGKGVLHPVNDGMSMFLIVSSRVRSHNAASEVELCVAGGGSKGAQKFQCVRVPDLASGTCQAWGWGPPTWNKQRPT